MKKINLLLIMLLTTATSLLGKCDWSKVYLAYGNSCNVYKFEIAGTVDTCYQTRTIVTNKKTLKKDTFYSRSFGISFSDTGKYNVFVKVYNKCLNCDTAFEKLLYVTCKPTTKPKCDWSKLGFGYGYSCNVYKFELGSIDTCLSYTTYIYSYKTSKVIDTFYTRTFVKVFSDTGKYKVYVLAKNKCGGCDTSFYRILSVTCNQTTITKCNWSKIGLGYSNNCGTVTFELGSKDTCITGYSLWAYNQNTHKLDTLAYDRVFRRTLDTGWYTFKASFHNKCCNSDTFIYKEVHIGCDSLNLGTSLLNKNLVWASPNPTDVSILICLTFVTKQPLIPFFIYNGSGQIIESGYISSCIQLNTSSWKDGIYTFRAGNLAQRFIVKH